MASWHLKFALWISLSLFHRVEATEERIELTGGYEILETRSCSDSHGCYDGLELNGAVPEQLDMCFGRSLDSLHHRDAPTYTHVDRIPLQTMTEERFIDLYAKRGNPVVVEGVTEDWRASEKWNHGYFRDLFSAHQKDLFASTFAGGSPSLDSDMFSTYFGFFVNDAMLAEVLREDYVFPSFVPHILRNASFKEWIHWGMPPCGAQRHVDSTCTARVSVQIKGKKRWRLFPPVALSSITDVDLKEKWHDVMAPRDVVVHEGDALVWWPGWAHETEITHGPSLSLSLHFIMPPHTPFLEHFRHDVAKLVQNPICDWI